MWRRALPNNGLQLRSLAIPVIATYRDAPSAYIAASILAAEEIPYRIVGEYTVGVQWLWSHAIGGVKIEVSSERAAEASALLERDHSVEPTAAELYTCPACASTDVRRGRLRKWSGILAFFTGVPVVAWSRGSSCGACGHRWKDAATV